jgi:hypothetical protein
MTKCSEVTLKTPGQVVVIFKPLALNTCGIAQGESLFFKSSYENFLSPIVIVLRS